MLFSIHCLDRHDGGELRQSVATAHAAYVRAHMTRIVFGGPLLATDGVTRIGTLIVVEMGSRTEAQEFLRNEPYCAAGLFARCEVHEQQLLVERGRPVPTR